ncbi:response regulator transcription factor [Enterococcus hulanensis]|uniref:response regulator transcription factor n=1 Tax=Enterococcus hulanensis TaxID=2559929 RepID=UPI00288FA3CF|nr:response regulator transcription factor [Enterococcus hulanensis]MDT2661955.1 response regulator transcription factor [Enterococcus hulanensis]
MKILLVEDEERLAEALNHILKKEGYVVDVSSDGLEAQALAETGVYDVIILDRMLPNKEGVEILKDLRRKQVASPVIFLTAKDTVKNRVEGLEAGADDYLIKPFANSELIARVRALSRRNENIVENDRLKAGKLVLNSKKCEVSIDQMYVTLSLKEAQLLELFIHNKGQTLTKEQILDRVWPFNAEIELKNVDLYTYYLRKKIDFPTASLSLETIRGVGYALKELPDA